MSAKTIGGWTEDFHRRRVDPLFPAFTGAASAFPSTFSRTFSKTTTDAGPQTLNFIHGMKCGGGLGEWGSIVIDAQPPVIKSSGIVSASGFGQFASVAPGSWIEIYGSNLSATSRSWADADFLGVNAPTSLDSTAVKIGGQSAFIDYVSPSQVNAQVPSNVPLGSQTVTVTTSVGTSPPLPVNVNVIQPGLNAPPSFIIGGKQYVAALFADGFTYVLPTGAIPGVASRRAKVGETIVLYGVGFGPVTPTLPAGQVVLLANSLIAPLQVSFGPVKATVLFAGLVSGSIGLYQFNVIVPNVVPNDAVPLTFTVGAVAGTQTLFIAIQN